MFFFSSQNPKDLLARYELLLFHGALSGGETGLGSGEQSGHT